MSSKKTSTSATKLEQAEENVCVVCFKNVEIYSIGDCDHPVCFECSTRLRVLCQQNECPICRHVLSKVIFTYDKLPYRELEAKNRSEYYSKKYKISFYDNKIQQAFFNLLEHPCPKCEVPPYRTFQGLKNHVRKEHDMHYCDICTDHLKIFTFERRCYTQAELGLHRTKGDADNKSHRGHPLCEYCNKRFLDRDELFRHLRREHYYCHFCDADGCNEFYRDYDALAEHFRQDHFLCEEGKCATEQFVGAFRTEIDYKAHIANVHGKLLNKQQAKQTRTLQLEITLGPRGRQMSQNIANVRPRDNEELPEEPLEHCNYYNTPQNQRSVTIDTCNERDFPSLAGAANGPSISLVQPIPAAMRNRSTAAGLARTKENFPALGGETDGAKGAPQRQQDATPISSILRKGPIPGTGAIPRTTSVPSAHSGNTTGMVLHVSNRPSQNSSTNNVSAKNPALDFPALPGKGKKQAALEEDMLPENSSLPLANISAKHRSLVDNYVSVAKPNSFQKIQMIDKSEIEKKNNKVMEKKSAPDFKSNDFPSLGNSSNKTPAPTNNWVKITDKKQRELENRKAKVAPVPLLPKEHKLSATSLNVPQLPTTKKDKKGKEKKSSETFKQQSNDTKGNPVNNSKTKEKNNNNNENENINKALKSTPLVPAITNGDGETTNSQKGKAAPPPGFKSLQNSIKPPPGFHSDVTVNSVAKSPNNLTFTSSLGESYSIVSTHSYIQPPDSATRNQNLVKRFSEIFKHPQALEEFRLISQYFREGTYKTDAYYEHCRSALGNKFDEFFPEFLALLPDISKQQELYLVHMQRMATMSPNQRKTLPQLDVCKKCKQVVLVSDAGSHHSIHKHLANFPTLSGGGATAKNLIANRK